MFKEEDIRLELVRQTAPDEEFSNVNIDDTRTERRLIEKVAEFMSSDQGASLQEAVSEVLKRVKNGEL